MNEEEAASYYDQYVVNPLLDFRPKASNFYRVIYRLFFICIVDINLLSNVQFEASAKEVVKPARVSASDDKVRLQDGELQKMSDAGKCLSMHQPYASLLVAGIKKYVPYNIVLQHCSLIIDAMVSGTKAGPGILRTEAGCGQHQQ